MTQTACNITNLFGFCVCSIQELLTIATCEMKEEDTDSQVLFWEMLNSVMVRNGDERADFHGFMADEAQANWRAIRTVFNGGPDRELQHRERSCLFHWKQSLQIHTSKYVLKDFQGEHKRMCESWREAESKDDATSQCRVIRQWWQTRKVRDNDIAAMDSWISWWGIRIAHWGEYMVQVNLEIIEKIVTHSKIFARYVEYYKLL